MFLRKLKNRSGSISVQIISKAGGKFKVLKSIGSGTSEQELEKLWHIGRQEISRLSSLTELFVSKTDTIVEQVFESLDNVSIRTVGLELIFAKGKIKAITKESSRTNPQHLSDNLYLA